MTNEQPMNLLLITCDQYRADALSCAGHPVLSTPNLDMLASQGVRFAQHYGQSAPCSPGRAALYTGLYTMNNRVIYQMYHCFVRRGFSVLRFNFRGVGRSQGVYDEGIGELSDAAAALDLSLIHI